MGLEVFLVDERRIGDLHVVVELVDRLRPRIKVVELAVLRVRTVEADRKAERLLRVLVPHELDGLIGGDLVDVPNRAVVELLEEGRLDVDQRVEHRRPLSRRERDAELADQSGPIAGPFEQRGEAGRTMLRGDRRRAEREFVRPFVKPGQDRSSARGADRRGHEHVAKAHAAPGEFVHVRRFQDRMIRAAHEVGPLVIGEDEEHIGALVAGHRGGW